jgi:hypothetical protein
MILIKFMVNLASEKRLKWRSLMASFTCMEEWANLFQTNYGPSILVRFKKLFKELNK